jgi:hypothetical protein
MQKKVPLAIPGVQISNQSSPRDLSIQNVYINRSIAKRQLPLKCDNERGYSRLNQTTLLYPVKIASWGKWIKQIPIVEAGSFSDVCVISSG